MISSTTAAAAAAVIVLTKPSDPYNYWISN